MENLMNTNSNIISVDDSNDITDFKSQTAQIMPDTSTPDEISIPGDDVDFPDDDMPDNDDIPGSNPSKLTPDPDFKGV